jgi:hypothetical protein
MHDERDPLTRLGPDSGGAGGGEPPGPGRIRVYGWQWGPDESRRPGLPWVGVFLLIFGGLLLIQQLYPTARGLGSVVLLAIGLAFLVKWVTDRGAASLYAGAIITALAVPGMLSAAGVDADGLTTFSLGVAFLFIAAVRAATGGGHGWQLWFGAILALLGGISIATPTIGGLIVPIGLVALGIVIILRGLGRR